MPQSPLENDNLITSEIPDRLPKEARKLSGIESQINEEEPTRVHLEEKSQLVKHASAPLL
jgi:hypothetical protein